MTTTEKKDTKVYAVWEGEYSDAHVVGVFSEEETAKQFAAIANNDPNRWSGDSRHVEEFILDEFKEAAQLGLSSWTVSSRPGSIEVADVWSAGACSVASGGAVVRRIDGGLGCTVMARDAEHAIKIAADKFREIVACGAPKP